MAPDQTYCLHTKNLFLACVIYVHCKFHYSDINECEEGSRCHKSADCINTAGSFTCRCKEGFEGDGVKECRGTDKHNPFSSD